MLYIVLARCHAVVKFYSGGICGGRCPYQIKLQRYLCQATPLFTLFSVTPIVDFFHISTANFVRVTENSVKRGVA